VTRISKAATVLLLALVAAVVAHYSVAQYPGGFAFAPSGSLAMYFELVVVSSKVGWLSPGVAFTTTCFVIAILLSFALLVGSKQALRVSTVMFALLAVSNAIHFVGNWEQGVALHGIGYVLKVLVVNIAFAATCGVLLLKARQHAADTVPLYQAHGLMLLWLGWVSVPYLGMITYG
jgi:predicted small integral membrane protein